MSHPCRACSREVEYTWQVCAYCGTPLNSMDEYLLDDVEDNWIEVPETSGANYSKEMRAAAAAMIGVGMMAMVYVACTIFGGNSANNILNGVVGGSILLVSGIVCLSLSNRKESRSVAAPIAATLLSVITGIVVTGLVVFVFIVLGMLALIAALFTVCADMIN